MAIDIIPLLLGLGSGAIGGNIAGGLMKSAMGPLGRSITGILGGTGLAAVGQQTGLFSAESTTDGASLSMKSIGGNVGSGLVGGGILTGILGMFNKA